MKAIARCKDVLSLEVVALVHDSGIANPARFKAFFYLGEVMGQGELALNGDVRMTVKEVSDILGVTPEAIRKHIRGIFPDIIINGKTTYLTDSQVTEIKRKMTPSTQVVGNVTRLEKAETILKAMEYINEELLSAKAENVILKESNALMAPKAALADSAIRDEKEHYSITQAGKHLEIRQSDIFSVLRAKHLIDNENLPTQKAIDAKVLQLRTNPSLNGRNRQQAIMSMENIYNFKRMYL